MSGWKTIILFNSIAMLLILLHAFTGKSLPPPPGKTVVTFWQPFGGKTLNEMRRLAETFNKSHPNIEVRTQYIPHSPSADRKLFMAIAAGIPPDCVITSGQKACEWALRGIFLPLDEKMRTHNVRNEDFWGPCAKQCQYDGKTYALTYCADPNFALFWNKDVFREEGMLEQGPPRTLEELDTMARRLTKRDANGRYVRIGFIPWSISNFANSLFTWGWAFGGEFFDEQTNRITCADDPQVLEALYWMKSYADEYGFEAINAFSEGFGDETDNPFARGKLALAGGYISNVRLFKQYAPDLDYGAVSIPYPEKMGFDHSAWMGGFVAGIPYGAQHPDAAFEFLKWICTDPEVGRSMLQTTGQFPGYKASAPLDLIKGNEKLERFYTILQTTRHQRPVMPAQAFYMLALDRAVSDVFNGRATPEDALRNAQIATQKELDRVLMKKKALPK